MLFARAFPPFFPMAFLWRGVAIGLLPRRDIDNRFGELVGVPRAFGGHILAPGRTGFMTSGFQSNKS